MEEEPNSGTAEQCAEQIMAEMANNMRQITDHLASMRVETSNTATQVKLLTDRQFQVEAQMLLHRQAVPRPSATTAGGRSGGLSGGAASSQLLTASPLHEKDSGETAD